MMWTENVYREQKMASFLFSYRGLTGKASIGHHGMACGLHFTVIQGQNTKI